MRTSWPGAWWSVGWFVSGVPDVPGGQDRRGELERENAELRRRLARLERVISRNSGMPPSTDDLPGRMPPARPARMGAGIGQRGQRKGTPGSGCRGRRCRMSGWPIVRRGSAWGVAAMWGGRSWWGWQIDIALSK